MNQWRRLLPYGCKHTRKLCGLGTLAVIAIACDLLKPWPLKLIVDSVLKDAPLPSAVNSMAQSVGAGAPKTLLVLLAGVSIFLFALRWVLSVAQAYVQNRVGTAMVYSLAGDLFRRLHQLSMPFHSRRKTGDLVKRVTGDCACGRDLFMNVLLPMFTSVVTLVGMAVVLFLLDPPLTLISLLVIPVLGASIWYFARPMTARTYEQYSAQGETSAFANELLSAAPLVRVCGRGTDEVGRFQSLIEAADSASLRATKAQLKFKLSVAVITSLAVATVIALGGIQVVNGKLTIGSLLVFLSYLQSLYSPLETLAYLSTGWASATAGAQRVFEVFDSPEEVKDPARPEALPTSSERGGKIEFDNVSFGYSPDQAVLQDVSFSIEPGETVALVGPSGAGKSALIAMIPRLFDPWRGTVKINGANVKHAALTDVRKSVSIVLQDDFILPLSVADNIAYGKPDATLEEIHEAARAAQADKFIERLPNGFQTVLGERGCNLSGGERQRLSIARAFLKAAPILIMDEPTSALDGETEAALIDNLTVQSRSRTVLLIAHRLSTVRKAHKILVLNRGGIIEAGSHHELMERHGLYARMRESQFGTPKESTLALV